MTNKQLPQWYSLIGKISAYSDSSEGSPRELAALRRGNSAVTENYAYPYVLPYTQGLKEEQKTALLRIAAALAEYRDIPTFQKDDRGGYRSFGSWCYQLSKRKAESESEGFKFNPDKPDTVGQRLAYLHTQNLEEAIQSVRRLLALASGLTNPPALDKQNLARTFLYWGNGLDPVSQENRRQILRDYYSSYTFSLDSGDQPAQ